MNPAAYRAMLDRTFARWPDKAKYRDTARLEDCIAWINGERVTIQVITIMWIDNRAERETPAQEGEQR